MNLRAIDVMRTVQAMYVIGGEWAKAASWAKEIAPYETAKLAAKPEEAPTETDEERAYRLRSAMAEMRKTAVGDDEAEPTAPEPTDGPEATED